ncbi:hypothetical protein BRC19_02320 [Candidatus Saccharibacteria bacterium QS_5_54_17]|nr:MAG: hypothetical protein BRC19_02320 [Candidatus Saccharibacteria bacterium QS_5_54_17]
MKKLLKKIIPKWVLNPLLGPYHVTRAVVAHGIHGFPGRGMGVIGVTGTNGKTTTANYLASVLRRAGYRVGLSSTTNFRVGEEEWTNELKITSPHPSELAKLLKRMRKAGVDWVVMEATSQALAQHRVWGVPFQVAVMTNLSPDHLDEHGSMENYAAAKAKLLRKARHSVVLNHDDDWYEYFRRQAPVAVYTYGKTEAASVQFSHASLAANGTDFRLKYGSTTVDTRLQLPGEFNLYNALAAATAAYGLGVASDDTARGLAQLTGVAGRMEPVETGQNFAVIIDYAHTPDAYQHLLESIEPLTKGKIIAVFGGAPNHDYTGLGQKAGELVDVAIVTDDEPMEADPEEIRRAVMAAAQEGGSGQVHEVPDRREGIAAGLAMAEAGDTVVLLGLGHQTYRRVAGQRTPWNDRQVVQDLLGSPATKT